MILLTSKRCARQLFGIKTEGTFLRIVLTNGQRSWTTLILAGEFTAKSRKILEKRLLDLKTSTLFFPVKLILSRNAKLRFRFQRFLSKIFFPDSILYGTLFKIKHHVKF